MHGHGDRPHLCFYPGCDRGIPGNGFPRRYNLFDHMKRVHDHKEELTTLGPAEDLAPRKTVGRKRKSPSSVSDEPASQRQKTQHVQLPHSPPPLALPSNVYEQPMMPGYPPEANHFNRRNQHRQRTIYSQWANQRDLLEFQMSSVRSPDDEAGLASISQNIEELRRLSHQARHG